ncbi:hypothetical protein AX17_004219 [Amanita inopinata Kibby_2008]|nr:hypothetical protein AX17_004219 [Amanita inopinata Kibby_2008]
MARGNPRERNNYRGGGYRGDPRARGGSGRGRGSSRGRGRAGPTYFGNNGIDFPVQTWSENDNYHVRGRPATPRGHGRGRGNNHTAPSPRPSTPLRGRGAPRGRGIGSPVQQVQHSKPKLGSNAPLSSLLHETRPLLRPVIFVRSSVTPFLFQFEEELLKPGVEDAGETEESHVPTAKRVAQVFGATDAGDLVSSGSDNEEDLVEIDFNETEKLWEVTTKEVNPRSKGAVTEEQFTGVLQPTNGPDVPQPSDQVEPENLEPEQQQGSSIGTQMAEDKVSEISTHPPPEPPDISSNQEPTIAVQNELPIVEDELNGDVASTSIIEAINRNATQAEFQTETLTAHISADNQSATTPTAVVGDENTVPTTPTEKSWKQMPTPSEPSQGGDETPGFYVDTTPTRSLAAHVPREATTTDILGAIDSLEDDQEIIVYVAPHPRSGRVTPAVAETPAAPPTLRTTSILTGLTSINEASPPDPSGSSAKALDTSKRQEPEAQASTSLPQATPFAQSLRTQQRQFVSPLLLASPITQRKAKLRVRRQEARIAKGRAERHSLFSFGAARQEKEWQELDGPDPRWEERRRGDSDIDWGDEDDGEGQAQVPLDDGIEEMDIDPELQDEKSMEAMKAFAGSMLTGEGSRFTTMDDIVDIEKLREEDEASDGGAEGSSDDESSAEELGEVKQVGSEEDELDEALHKDEEKMMAEAFRIELSDLEEGGEDDSSNDDDNSSPRANFQARLERMRKLTQGKQADTSIELAGPHLEKDEDDEDDFDDNFKWAEHDDMFLEHIEDVLDENDAILSGRVRKQKKRLFKAINNGDHDDLSTFTVAKRKKDKLQAAPLSLQQQWEKDRVKKAERKALRDIARLEAAMDPLAQKKGGKKGHKAMQRAARLDPTITVIGPNRVIDMTTLVQQIQRFLANPSGPRSMSLPPTDKYTRKLIHEMATAFDMKSKSRGDGDARHTTLTRTSGSGLYVDKRKVSWIMRQGNARGAFSRDNEDDDGGGGERGGKGKRFTALRQKEGEEVGKEAPKIDSTNIGFKMLEAMGWSEGNRVGVTGGLDAPLTAIIKRSKLGLGATRQ